MNKNSEFIVIVIDHFSKLVETKVINCKTGREVANILEKIIGKNGRPERIISGNVNEFNNQHIQLLKRNYNIEWEYSSPYHHNTVGAVERAVQTIMNKLRKITNFGKKSWKEYLESATYAYNISINRAIGMSPHFLKFNKHPVFEIDEKK